MTDRSAVPEIVLDLSRLLSRVLHTTPTGVDRVEMAYARGLLSRVPGRVRFAAVHPGGGYGRLPLAGVLRFLDETERGWGAAGGGGELGKRVRAVRNGMALRSQWDPRRRDGSRVYLQASPHHLDRADWVSTILARERARLICLVHDLIPIEHPEYARPKGAEQHLRRITTIVAKASGIIANSAATLRSLQPYLDRAGATPLVTVAHLGTHETIAPRSAAVPPGDPYFVCIGTIEPRKNHLLLLNIWRRLAENGSGPIPRLVLIGRRGWENEQVVDMLDRCHSLDGHVIEHGRLPDQAVIGLLRGARALLLPSFAEGYGMPVAEALAEGVPVLCSDLPALREAGGVVPEYLDPLDGPAWLGAIMQYADPDSQRRRDQIDRMPLWQPVSWSDHIDSVLDLVDRVAQAT